VGLVLSGIEVLVDAIEVANPTHVSFFCPRFSVGFLWKLIDELSLYRRKNLEEFNVYVLSFNNEEESVFSLNECIEIQEFFSNVHIFSILPPETEYANKLLPGFLYLNGNSSKAYNFETDFSIAGFQNEKPLATTAASKVLIQLSEISNASVRVDRDLLSQAKHGLPSSSKSSFWGDLKNPDFTLWFVSARTGQVHNAGAGLNWGQPTETRNRKDINSAYLPVPTCLQKSLNLPLVNQIFSCRFDDGVEIEMVRTGANGKNLTSAHENQIFGRYVRYKLGVPPGRLILQNDLERSNIYGLSFFKQAQNTYFLKFINRIGSNLSNM
jgi:NgoFVII restriction endonuclease